MAAVDVEDESILASIFKDSFPENWREKSDFAAYLSQLCSCGVDELNREPERLAEERAQILQQTRELAFTNYKTFIRTADCTQHIYTDFSTVENCLSKLVHKLPSFTERCRGFIKEAEEISVSRRMNSLTLNRHTEILEILEIPQLMDTCVRNGYYEEALELAAYVKRLEKKHASLPVIQGIVHEVQLSAQLMLNQLLQQLRSNTQLPVCLRVIGYLRRMDVFTEAELRVKFLQARGSWLRSILAAIPDEDPYFHITKTIETCRVHLFDIITQYRAIFSDEDPLLPPGGKALNESAIFHGWVVLQVAQFLETLDRDLQRGVGSRLDSLLGHTIPPAVPSTQPGTLQPPMALLDFPPLACFLNNVLTAFNDLRLCCPIGLAQEVSRCVEEALIKVTKLILVFHRAEESAFSSRERELFVQFCSAFAEDMVPFLNRCLQVLFPPAQLALILGVPPTQVYKYGSLGCINVNAVLEPLEFVLPQKEPVTSVLDLCTDLSSLTTAESDPSTALKPTTPQEEKPVLSEQEPVSASDPRLSQKENISAEAVNTEQNNPILEPEMTFDEQDLTGPDELSTTDINVEEMLSK
uniref:Conserved oligomeric Golgi complex subunit 8 n=1 Tax=Cyprinus carpio carpio TaxID=630221 RepID=A0A9J8BKS2_CYPCA